MCLAAGGGAGVAGSSAAGRKSAEGNAALLGEQGKEGGVRLLVRKPADGTARDAAAQLNGGNNFFHAGDRRARKGFTIELHGETAILRIADVDSGSVLARTAEEEFTEAIAFAGIVTCGAPKDKR